jgi:hypothetical protein
MNPRTPTVQNCQFGMVNDLPCSCLQRMENLSLTRLPKSLFSFYLSINPMEPCCRERNWPEERGHTETLPGRKTETDRVFEGISEGCRPAESGRVAPRGPVANDIMAPSPPIDSTCSNISLPSGPVIRNHSLSSTSTPKISTHSTNVGEVAASGLPASTRAGLDLDAALARGCQQNRQKKGFRRKLTLSSASLVARKPTDRAPHE